MNIAVQSEPLLRIGTLCAAKITPLALLRPAQEIPGVAVTAIAARDPRRGQKFAARYGIPNLYNSYQALLDSPEVDAVYIPLPNSLHCEWTLRALAACKHVLCEKPLAANAEQASQMAAAANSARLILTEAFHYRYHPLAPRMKEIVSSGQLGQIQHLEAHLNTNVFNPWDIRFNFQLGGGALMDTGSYTVNLLRFLAGAEPRVLAARARCISPQVDRWMEADLAFHREIARVSENEIFGLMLDSIADLGRESRRATMSEAGVGRAVKQHAAVLKAILGGEPKAAEKAMRVHIESAVSDLLAHGGKGKE
jgi:predicted dehydrogenase